MNWTSRRGLGKGRMGLLDFGEIHKRTFQGFKEEEALELGVERQKEKKQRQRPKGGSIDAATSTMSNPDH